MEKSCPVTGFYGTWNWIERWVGHGLRALVLNQFDPVRGGMGVYGL
jgi:hypothetical protein